MEDPNMLAADCVVICCCCQCLILQIFIFVLLKLPYKLIRKTRDYAKKRLRQRKKHDKNTDREIDQYEDDHGFVGMHSEESFRIEVDSFFRDGDHHNCGSCMEEVEKVLEELSQKGEFAFGSFWGRKGSGGSSPNCVAKHEFDAGIVQYHIIEMVDSFSYYSRSNIILPFRLTV